MSLTGNSNAERIWNFLKAKGLSDCGIAGLMGNLYAESGLEPTNLQNSYESALGFTDASYTAAVDKGTYSNFTGDAAGYGLAQWTYWTRKRDLLAFAKAAGRSVGDLETQLDYLWKELTESYTGVLKVLKTASTIKEASDKVLTEFERPADMGNAVKTRRAGYGQRYYEDYAIQSGSDAAQETKEPAKAETVPSVNVLSEDALRQKIVDIAVSYLGCNEADGSHKQIIDTYNSHRPLPVGYKVKYTDAWCSTFASVPGIIAGLTAIIPVECGCGRHIQLFKDLGCWVEDDSYVPKPGDFMFYDWDDSGVGDNTGGADHVGIVEKISGSTIVVIEGNYSNSVKRRELQVNGKYIRGYGVPNYASIAGTVGDEPKDNTGGDSYTAAELKVGDIVTFTGSKHYKSANASRGYNCKAGKAKITAVHQLGTSKHPYHLIATDGSESTVYGWVDEDCIAEAGEQAAAEPWTPAVGDLVNFTGSRHHLWVNASTGPSCRPGLARITSIYMPGKTKHPYHLVAVSGGGSNVYGWVDEGTFTKA